MRPLPLVPVLLCAAAVLVALPVRAEEPERPPEEKEPAKQGPALAPYLPKKGVDWDNDGDEDDEEAEKKRRPALHLEFGGYGDLQFAYYNYGENQNREGGSQRDSRLAFDTTRLVLELEAGLPRYGLEAEMEVEFEHGGAGSAMELEYEESGEFEQEVEKGGEALVEELYMKKKFGEHFSVQAGRFYVAVGTLSEWYRPTDYLGTIRSEAETLIIPNTWDEMGVQGQAKLEGLTLTAQVVNGLDSTAFSSQHWVALGHQHRFELNRATDLAAVLRADVTRFKGFVFGASGYYGDTTRNRPKPDLVKACEEANDHEVAPCGYVSAPLLVLDTHLSVDSGRWRAKAMAMWGYLQNADDISARNARLSTLLNVLRTPVAEHALALWGELGFNVAPSLGLGDDHRLEPFVRFDYADSMLNPRTELFDNPRFARSIYTVGTSYTLAGVAFAKVDFSHRRLGDSSRFRPENTVRFSTGFSY